jgi:hypothetical protein
MTRKNAIAPKILQLILPGSCTSIGISTMACPRELSTLRVNIHSPTSSISRLA